MANYTIQDTTLTNMANAIRDMWGEPSTNTMTPQMMIDKIKDTHVICNGDNPLTKSEGPWTRPSTWPDLDSLTLPARGDGDVLYLTYDLSKTEGQCDPFISIYNRAGAAGTIYVKRGHISNNEFVADETYSQNIGSGSNWVFEQELDSTNGNIQLWQVTATVPLTRVGFARNSTKGLTNGLQPCVEKYGRLDNLTYMSGTTTATSADLMWGTFWLEREKLYLGGIKSNSYLGSLWSNCFSLRSLDVTNWNTTSWTVSSVQSLFAHCRSLPEVDLSHWDTSNWTVTSLNYMFYCCFCLKHIDLDSWNTSNWAVTKMENMFSYSPSLATVKMNSWDTSNWAVTTLAYMFTGCSSLQSINLNHWDTSNWEVTAFNNVFYQCSSLHTVEIGEWNTSNWAVTNMSYIFSNCQSLENLDIGDWDTSNWTIQYMTNWFSTCYSLKELDLSKWDTSKWKPTSMQSTFNSMYSLRKLDISGWDTSGWTTLTSLSSVFSSCFAKEIYLPADFLCNSSYNDSWVLNTQYFIKSNGYPYKYSHTYAAAYLMTHDTIVATFNRLPTVSNKTITLGSANINKVSAAEIAIATAKGWTVA